MTKKTMKLKDELNFYLYQKYNNDNKNELSSCKKKTFRINVVPIFDNTEEIHRKEQNLKFRKKK